MSWLQRDGRRELVAGRWQQGDGRRELATGSYSQGFGRRDIAGGRWPQAAGRREMSSWELAISVQRRVHEHYCRVGGHSHKTLLSTRSESVGIESHDVIC